MFPCHLLAHTGKGFSKGRRLDSVALGGHMNIYIYIYIYTACIYVLSSKTFANPLGTLKTCEPVARRVSQYILMEKSTI